MSDTILDYRVLAGKAADEIERRGWITGDLAETEIEDTAFEWPDDKDPAYWEKVGDRMIAVPLEDCRVCALGALNAAYSGKPYAVREGLSEYDALLEKIADLIEPDWREDKDYAHRVITDWNDEVADDAAQVVAKLRWIAAGQ